MQQIGKDSPGEINLIEVFNKIWRVGKLFAAFAYLLSLCTAKQKIYKKYILFYLIEPCI